MTHFWGRRNRSQIDDRGGRAYVVVMVMLEPPDPDRPVLSAVKPLFPLVGVSTVMERERQQILEPRCIISSGDRFSSRRNGTPHTNSDRGSELGRFNVRAVLAVAESPAILLRPPPPLAGASIATDGERASAE